MVDHLHPSERQLLETFKLGPRDLIEQELTTRYDVLIQNGFLNGSPLGDGTFKYRITEAGRNYLGVKR